MKTLKDLFLDELADMYDSERRIVKALPKMAKAATSNDLKSLFQAHLAESAGHVKTLERVFESFGSKAKGKTCEATQGLLEEGDEVIEAYKGSPAINAGLISIAQKVEHYEMASYGCLREWAGLLKNREVASLFEEILEQESDSNESLTKLARAQCNDDAMGKVEEARRTKPSVRPMASPRRLVRPVAAGRKGSRAVL